MGKKEERQEGRKWGKEERESEGLNMAINLRRRKKT